MTILGILFFLFVHKNYKFNCVKGYLVTILGIFSYFSEKSYVVGTH